MMSMGDINGTSICNSRTVPILTNCRNSSTVLSSMFGMVELNYITFFRSFTKTTRSRHISMRACVLRLRRCFLLTTSTLSLIQGHYWYLACHLRIDNPLALRRDELKLPPLLILGYSSLS